MVGIEWRELGAGVFVRRHEDLDLNCGLVVGTERALVVDTGGTSKRGEELAAAVREITALEPVVVNTHAHFDHCFGNAAFRDSQIYAHVGAADSLRATGEHQRQQVMNHLNTVGRADEATDLESSEIVLPFYLIERDVTLDLGGRSATLVCGGRAHTDHDITVAVPEADVVFWGDLVEQGADPSMEDAFPLEWASTLQELRRHPDVQAAGVAVPGHGDVVDSVYVDAQAEQLGHLSQSLTEALAESGPRLDVLIERSQQARLGFDEATLHAAAVRALETASQR